MRKENQIYYFSVEGETEKWYLDWLQNTINAEPAAKYTVKLDGKIPVMYNYATIFTVYSHLFAQFLIPI